jgi:hypothetical protein
VYLSNYSIKPGLRGWKSPHDSWKSSIEPFIRKTDWTWDLYSRITPPPKDEHRLIIDTCSKSHRRSFIAAVRRARGPIKITPHLTDTEKSHKTHVYRHCDISIVQIEDRGDYLLLKKRSDPKISTMVALSHDLATIDRDMSNIIAKSRAPPPPFPTP